MDGRIDMEAANQMQSWKHCKNKIQICFTANNFHNEENLFLKVRYFLILGRGIGLIPCVGLFQKNVANFQYKYRSLPFVTTASIVALLMLHNSVNIVGAFLAKKRNALEMAWAAGGPIYYALGIFFFSYFLTRGKQFAELFQKWSIIDIKTHPQFKDQTLSRDAGIIVGILFVSAVFENIVWTWQRVQAFEYDLENEGKTLTTVLMMKYYYSAHDQWGKHVPYHEVWVIIGALSNKFVIYAWNFVDILIAVLSRAIYFKFKACSKVAEEKGNIALEQLITYHQIFCNILDDFQRFLGPLIFAAYAANIFFGCLMFLEVFRPANSIADAAYRNWGFLHLITRTLVVSISASKINTYAHQFGTIMESCPMELYTSQMERLERKLNCRQIGLHGLGYFTITKPFILGIIGVVFTFEIVLLQSLSTSHETHA